MTIPVVPALCKTQRSRGGSSNPTIEKKDVDRKRAGQRLMLAWATRDERTLLTLNSSSQFIEFVRRATAEQLDGLHRDNGGFGR